MSYLRQAWWIREVRGVPQLSATHLFAAPTHLTALCGRAIPWRARGPVLVQAGLLTNPGPGEKTRSCQRCARIAATLAANKEGG